MNRDKQILEAAATLPPAQARRFVMELAAKTQDAKTQDPREETAGVDSHLEAAADAMQAALEAAVMELIETQGVSNL